MLFQTPFDKELCNEQDYCGEDYGHIENIRLSQDLTPNTIKTEDSFTGYGGRLTAPLSTFGNGLNFVPVRDMAEWVKRPIGVRIREALYQYPPRPMNSFMLYRSAYIQRAKIWSPQHKQQVLSALIGQSWHMEDPEIKKMYMAYAAIEKENHQIAHKMYRFSPRRKKPSASKKSGLKQRDPGERQYEVAGQGFTELVFPINDTFSFEPSPAVIQHSQCCSSSSGPWCMASYDGITHHNYAIGSAPCRHGELILHHTACSEGDGYNWNVQEHQYNFNDAAVWSGDAFRPEPKLPQIEHFSNMLDSISLFSAWTTF
jgi:hypothetical protein